MKREVFLKVFLVVVQALILLGCDTSNRDWERAEKGGSIDAYEQFLEKHSKSKMAGLASQKIEQLEWEKTQKVGTLEAYKKFLEKHSESPLLVQSCRLN